MNIEDWFLRYAALAQQEVTTMDEAENTDVEVWRRTPGDYYSPSIHVTKDGGIGMNVGGRVIVMDIEDWFLVASDPLMGR